MSQWGHDFRPDYFRLADAARWLGRRRSWHRPRPRRRRWRPTSSRGSACATRCAWRRGSTARTSPSRSSRARPRRPGTAASRGLAEEGALPAIVYAGTRNECDKLSTRLARELGVRVERYHAGLARDVRAEAQRRFMAGESPVVVATNAFGMGVDKADVRTVCHETVPGSVEAYYQEAGRAGRDGKPARCLLFASSRTRACTCSSSSARRSTRARITTVAKRLLGRAVDGRFAVGLQELRAVAGGAEDDAVRAIVGHLARAGVIQPSPSPPDLVTGRVTGEWDGRALARLPHVGARGDEGALAPVPLRMGVGRGLDLPPPRHPAPLRRPERAAGRGPVLRRLRSLARCPRRRLRPRARGRRPAQLAQRPAAGDLEELDDAILDVVGGRPARRRPHPRGRGAARRALEGDRQVQLRRAAGLRHLRPPRGPRRCSSASTRCCRRARCARPAGGSRSSKSREDRRPRLGGGHQPAGDPRPRARPRGRRGRRGRLRQAGRAGARARAGGGRRRPRSFARDDFADRAPRATPRWRSGWSSSGVALVVLAGYMQLLTPASSIASRSA